MMKRALTLALAVAWVVCLMGNALAETMIVTSDWHLTQNAEAHMPALMALRGAAAGCDGLLVLGDSTNNAHAGEHRFVLESLNALRRLTGAAVYAIPGNHDLSAHYRQADFAAAYAAYGQDGALSRDAASASCAVMTAGGACLLLLDTNACDAYGLATAWGGLSEATLGWVEAVLAALAPGTTVIACGHHPILPPESRTQTANAGRLAEVLRRGGVRLYLCGHDHGFAAVAQDGLQQITVGQPHTYPGWAGRLEIGETALAWRVVPLYAEDDLAWTAMSRRALGLGESIARGALKGSRYERDEGAVAWFAECFRQAINCSLTKAGCAALLANPNARKWREIETRTVAKRWMFGLLENCPQDVRAITVPLG